MRANDRVKFYSANFVVYKLSVKGGTTWVAMHPDSGRTGHYALPDTPEETEGESGFKALIDLMDYMRRKGMELPQWPDGHGVIPRPVEARGADLSQVRREGP